MLRVGESSTHSWNAMAMLQHLREKAWLAQLLILDQQPARWRGPNVFDRQAIDSCHDKPGHCPDCQVKL